MRSIKRQPPPNGKHLSVRQTSARDTRHAMENTSRTQTLERNKHHPTADISRQAAPRRETTAPQRQTPLAHEIHQETTTTRRHATLGETDPSERCPPHDGKHLSPADPCKNQSPYTGKTILPEHLSARDSFHAAADIERITTTQKRLPPYTGRNLSIRLCSPSHHRHLMAEMSPIRQSFQGGRNPRGPPAPGVTRRIRALRP